MWSSLEELASDFGLASPPHDRDAIVAELASKLRDGGMESPGAALLVDAYRYAKSTVARSNDLELASQRRHPAIVRGQIPEIVGFEVEERAAARRARSEGVIRHRYRRQRIPLATVSAAIAVVWAMPESSSPLLQSISPYVGSRPVPGRFEIWLAALLFLAEYWLLLRQAESNDTEVMQVLHDPRVQRSALTALQSDGVDVITQAQLEASLLSGIRGQVPGRRRRRLHRALILVGAGIAFLGLAARAGLVAVVPAYFMVLSGVGVAHLCFAAVAVGGLKTAAFQLRRGRYVSSTGDALTTNDSQAGPPFRVWLRRAMEDIWSTDQRQLAGEAAASAIERAVAAGYLTPVGHRAFEALYRLVPDA